MCYGPALLVAIIAMQEVKTKITIKKKENKKYDWKIDKTEMWNRESEWVKIGY